MPFPTTPVLTTFTGADENPLVEGGNFAVAPIAGASNPCQRVGNACTGTAVAANLSYWTPTTFVDSEAFATLTTLPSAAKAAYIALRLVNIGAGTTDGYLVAFARDVADAYSVLLYRVDNSTPAQLGATITGVGTMTANDVLGVRMVGSVLHAFINGVDIGSRTDATYAGAGALGTGGNDTTFRTDNFGGGKFTQQAMRTLVGPGGLIGPVGCNVP